MKTRTLLLSLTLLALAQIMIATEAAAIPAFARKYNLSCTTCHAPMPRLKDYGNDFAANGFRLAESEEPARAYRETGDATLTLQREFPVAVRLDAYATFETREEGDDLLDLKTPWALKLLSGGSVAPNVGYYFYFFMSERGEVSGIEDAYLHFNDLGGIPLDVLVGQFQLCDPMMKRELRLSFEDYEIYRVRVGGSLTNLTYDRGVVIAYDTPFGLGLVGQVVNGNGKGEAGESGSFDGDPDKGYALRAVYGAGPVTVGGFYYSTRETLVDGVDAFENEIEMIGPDVHVAFADRASLSVQYLLRTDSDPLEDTGEIDTEGIVAELTLQPWGPDAKNSIVLLYNRIDSDLDVHDYETWTASFSRLHRRNLRMIAEVTYDAELEESRLVAGFSSAF